MKGSWTPQLRWPDSLHQPKRQCKEHYPLCFSSKHLWTNQAGHQSQFAKQGETLDPTAQFCVQHSWRQPVQKQPCREGQQQMVCYVTALYTPPTEPEPRQGCRAGDMRDSKQNCSPHTSHAAKKHCTKLETWASLSSRNLSNLQQRSWALGGKFTGLGCSHIHRRKNTWCPYYCSDQGVLAVRNTSMSGGRLVTRLGTPGEKLPQGKSWCPNCPVCRKEKCPAPGEGQQEGTVLDSEELPLLGEGLREISSTATSHAPAPSSTDRL